jgi:hypothetical protein
VHIHVHISRRTFYKTIIIFTIQNTLWYFLNVYILTQLKVAFMTNMSDPKVESNERYGSIYLKGNFFLKILMSLNFQTLSNYILNLYTNESLPNGMKTPLHSPLPLFCRARIFRWTDIFCPWFTFLFLLMRLNSFPVLRSFQVISFIIYLDLFFICFPIACLFYWFFSVCSFCIFNVNTCSCIANTFCLFVA